MSNFTLGTLSLYPKNKQVPSVGGAEEKRSVLKEEGGKKTSRQSKVHLVAAQQQGPKHLIGTAFNAQVLLTWVLCG